MLLKLLFSACLCLSLLHTISALSNSLVEDPPEEMSNGTLYSISAFSPKVFVRTDEFSLNYSSCAQFSYKLLDKKVRLRGYTCHLSEGGFCTLDKFAYPKHTVGCASLRPWTFKNDRFSFYFVLERRARKYGAHKKHRSRKVKRSGRVDARPFGHLTLEGIVPCDEACK